MTATEETTVVEALDFPPGAPPPVVPPPRPERGVRAVLREASRWGELRATPHGLSPAVIIGFVFFIGVFESAAFEIALPDMARDLRFTQNTIISLIVVTHVFAICGAMFAGYAADRRNRIAFLGGGAIVEGIFAMLTGAAGSADFLGTFRAGDEVATAGTEVPSFALLADYYPIDVRGRVFAIVGSVGRTGRLFAPIVIGFLVTTRGWRPTFVIAGVPLVLIGLLALARLREPGRGYFERRAAGLDDETAKIEDEPVSFGEGWRTMFAVRTVRRLFFADILLSAGDTVFGVFFVVILLPTVYRLDALHRGYVLTPAIAGGLLGTYVGGGLVDALLRRNPGRVVTLVGASAIVQGLGFAGVCFKPHLWILVVSFTIGTFGASLVGPAARALYAQVIPPSTRTQGIQTLRLAELFGIIVLLPLGGTVVFRHGIAAGLELTIPFFIVGGLVQMTAGKFFAFDMRNNLASSVAAEEYRQARAAGRGKLLVCRDVDVEYDGVQVLFGVDFDVDVGQIIALLGTNGAGKSTLLRAISGSQEASAGAIVYDGRDITHMPPHEIASRGIVQMPGGRGVFPGLTVRENLLLGNWLVDDEAEVRRALLDVYELFPVLRERADELAGSLSGGQQQMLSLAQAFLSRPRLLLIDELSLGLAPAMVQQLVEVVRRIHERGVTIVIVEQSVNVALTIAEQAIFMEKGEIKFNGPTADLLRRPDILRAVYVKGSGALTDAGTATRADQARRARAFEAARSVLRVDHVVKRFGGVVAVDDLSLQLREGEALGIIGPNGSGKTTLFDVIAGFQPADGGAIFLDDVDVSGLSAEARARLGLVRRFQDARLFPSLTVFETLLVALEGRLEVKSTFLHAAQLPQARRAERRLRLRAERLLDLLELGSYRDKFVKELSTGLRRIVDLACVLAAEPKVLLLDEPSSGIAQAEAEGLAPLLRRVRYESGCSLLIIEHDMPLISAVADELLALEQGRVLVRGLPDVVLNDERVIESYLGTSEAVVQRSGLLS